MTDRIGIFICECGKTLDGALDIAALARAARRMDGVAHVAVVALICAPDAGMPIVDAIREQTLDRVVFAACSPREHTDTFRKILTDAGRNPYLMQTANIREQCAWTIHDREQATAKAIDLTRAAVRRVRHHRPLAPREIDCRTDVMVIGAGVAGIAAARTLVQDGRRVYLVERSPCIGGRTALYEDLFPDLNCAACLLEPDLDALLHDHRITLFTLAEVAAVKGYAGNFSVVVRQAPRYIDPQRCIGCEACLAVCPASCTNAYNAGMDRRTAVYIPYPGALPHLAAIDDAVCRHLNGADCSLCREACPFDAVDFDQVETTHTLSVGAIVIATGFSGFDAKAARRYGGGMPDVISSFAFERLVNTAGPSAGSVLTAGGAPPGDVALVHCVGSRSAAASHYCSGLCCSHALKHARQIKTRLPDAGVHLFFADLCLPGKTAQRFFDDLAREPGVHLHRMAQPDAVRIEQNAGRCVVRYTAADGHTASVAADLVVLATAMAPPKGAGQLAQCMDVDLDRDGFFEEAHPITDPVASSRPGIYLAGCCQGPKTVPASITQGQAAAGRILQTLTPGAKISLAPTVACVDAALCSGCRTCEALCPCGAITAQVSGEALVVQESLCRGCGICAAACPSGAIQVCHDEAATLAAEIGGALGSGPGDIP